MKKLNTSYNNSLPDSEVGKTEELKESIIEFVRKCDNYERLELVWRFAKKLLG